MESRITKKFEELKRNKQKAFVPFITAGDPDLKTTENLIYSLEKSGASIIELGMPFSDPMADGPAIQRANERALKNGIHLKDILELVKWVRTKTQIPILLMGYYNPIFQHGLKKFVKEAHQAGVDGLLIVDLPPEEAAPLRDELKNKPIDLIYLLTPTSTKDRIGLVKKHGSGFVYYVSFTGITGASQLDPKAVAKKVKAIKQQIKIPINVGFGISKPEHVKKIAPHADGVVVGSAIIKLVEKHQNSKSVYKLVEKYVRSLVSAL